MISNAPNINRLWADLIIDELVRHGVTRFVIAPGSRSTPLVTAIAAHPQAEATIHYDERGTAFFALGYARATGRPAVWVTTSGTAVANGYPAVIEAAQDGVPLILLTADRPPELRDTGSNQTIDQQRMFGPYVRWFFDLPAANQTVEPQFVLTTVDQVVHRSMTSPPGPVQLNCMFREPLAPVDDGADYRGHMAMLARRERTQTPYTTYERPLRVPSAESIAELAVVLNQIESGIVVAGRLLDPDYAKPIADLARALNWPVMADINSQLRFKDFEELMPYHAILGSRVFRDNVRPMAVLHFGAPVVSNRLAQYLRGAMPEHYILVHDSPHRVDPDHMITHRFDCEPGAFCRELSSLVNPAGSRWIGRWRSARRDAASALEGLLGDDADVSEPWLARTLPTLLPNGAGLFLGSSMPVRDADFFAYEGLALRVGSNRGASGIDGTLATAVGYCTGHARPTALVIGDVAMLHDLNSLGLARSIDQPFPIIVINNDGGAIFSFLQISAFEDVFEKYFGTPHGLWFEQAAGMFGIPYEAPNTRSEFENAVRRALEYSGATLIEVTTNREQNAQLHRRIDERLAESISVISG